VILQNLFVLIKSKSLRRYKKMLSKHSTKHMICHIRIFRRNNTKLWTCLMFQASRYMNRCYIIDFWNSVDKTNQTFRNTSGNSEFVVPKIVMWEPWAACSVQWPCLSPYFKRLRWLKKIMTERSSRKFWAS
jgi:hypothetical protein